jgi:hypothetical protein
MKKIILITILFLILIGIIFLYFNKYDFKFKGFDKGDLGSFYSYTKAICNETNYCQDYEIVCKNGEIINKNPITGAAIQHPLDWKDPRDNETINELCN